jgi:hypothetical protein
MKTSQFTTKLLACAMTLFIAACSGGGGGTSVAGGGTGGTGISAGSVSNFGSIFVNGVEFDTTSATYFRNGSSFTRPVSTPDSSLLKLGMTVEVQGSITSSIAGTASIVKVQEIVRGPVESVTGTAAVGTLVVLGQTVQVDDTTRIDSTSLASGFTSISTSNVLEVHGIRRPDGKILASYIERQTPPVTFSVRGFVAAHSSATQSFSIGGLQVAYAGGSIGNMPAPSGSNWNGLLVAVSGTTTGSQCNATPVCGILAAGSVAPAGLTLTSASAAEIEGFVTALVSTSDFTLNAQRVVTTGSTIYSGGVVADIMSGTRLEVEGSLAGGVLTATKVRFKDNVVIDANATAPTGIHAGDSKFLEIEGMPGVTITANEFTDLSNANGASFSDLHLLYGRSVRIRGHINLGATGGTVIATRIQDHNTANTSGPMTLIAFVPKNLSLTGPTFTMLGVLTVDTSAPSPNFKDQQGLAISSATFFAGLKNGAMVTATHQLSDPLTSGSAFLPGALKEVQLGDSQD